MARILATVGRLYSNQFKCDCLKNQKRFVNIFLPFWNLNKILNFLKKKHETRSLSISEIIHSEKRGYLNAWKNLFQNAL